MENSKQAKDIFDKFVVSGKYLIGYSIIGDGNYLQENDDFNEACLRAVIKIPEIPNEIDVLLDFLLEKEIKGKPFAETLKHNFEKTDSVNGDKLTLKFFKSLKTIEKLIMSALESVNDEEKENITLALKELRRWKEEGFKVENLNSIKKLEQLEKFKYSKVVTKKDYWRFMFKYEKIYHEVNKLIKQIPCLLNNLDVKNQKIKSVEVSYLFNEQQFPSKEEIVKKVLNEYEYIKKGFDLFCEKFYNIVPDYVIEKIKNLTSGVFSLELLNTIKLEFHEPSTYLNTFLYESNNEFKQIGYENFSKDYMSFFDLMKDYVKIKTEYILLKDKVEQRDEGYSYSHNELKKEIQKMFEPNSMINRNVQEMELIYGIKLKVSSNIAKFISNLSAEPIFYKSTPKFLRQLDFDSIKNFHNEYGIDVSTKKLIPLFDIADAQFIVYDLNDDSWGIWHIDDKQPYSKKKILMDVLKLNGF